MTSDLDIGPLSWVKSEIDLALERAGEALTEHAGNPAGGALATALKQLHQAHGALSIVGLDGVTEFSLALEQCFERLASGALPWSDAHADIARQGLQALRSYLDGLMDGAPNQPVRLMPAYSALIGAGGATAPSPAALFFPDLSQRPPRREIEPPVLAPDKLAARIKLARVGFERGLLKWLKQPDEAARGLAEMKNAVAMIEATQIQPAERAFWWAALGFFEALVHDGYASNSVHAEHGRKLAMRIGAQIKHFSEGRHDTDPRLLAEILYLVAVAQCTSELVATVRAAYRLDALIPHDDESQANALRPQIRRLRELINGAKEDWTKLCSGAAAALPPFHETITQFGELAPALRNAALSEVSAALVALTDALRRDPTKHNDSVALEVATALLLCDSALENFASLDADFAAHASTMAGRLQALLEQRDLDALAVPHLDAMARRAQEKLLLATVAQEVQANLTTVEQALDAYFRDQSKLASLAELARPLKQVEGALLILGQDRAVTVLADASRTVAELASGARAADKSVFEDVAGKLSGIGFFVDELQHGATPDIDAILAPRRRIVSEAAASPAPVPVSAPESDFGAAPPAAELATESPIAPATESPAESAGTVPAPDEEATVAPTAATLPEPPPAEPAAAEPAAAEAPVPAGAVDENGEAIDSELLEIFLEEARDVLATIGETLPLVRTNPHDAEAMTTLRRSFHTLKGSGRMVHLNELGEAAWGIEQVMNLWLQEKRPASPDLLTLFDQSLEVFGHWVEQLNAGGSSHYDATDLNRGSAALLAGEALPAAAAPSAEAPAKAETETAAALPAAATSAEALAPEQAAEPMAAEAPVSASDERSLDELLAAMEAQEVADETRKIEEEVAAAELALAEAAQHAEIAVPPAPTFTLPDLPAAAEAAEAVPAFDSPESRESLESLATRAAPAPAATPAAPLPSVSDEELLAAELAAAEVMAEGAALALPDVEPALELTEAEPVLEDLAAADTSEIAEAAADASLAQAPAEIEPMAETAAVADELPLSAPAAEAWADTGETPALADEAPPTPEPVRIGDLEISSTLFAIYIEEAQQHLATIQAEIGGTGVPSDSLIRAAHTLGSTSGTTGIDAIYHLARALEVALGGLAIVDTPPTDAQRLLLARCAGALEGMLGAVMARRLPGAEEALTAELRLLKPEPVSDSIANTMLGVGAGFSPEVPAFAPESFASPAPEGAASAAAPEIEFALPEPPPPETPPLPPPAEEEPEEHRHTTKRLEDEIDEQLLPIFLEEAADLMASIDAQLRGWRGEPENEAFAKQLQRDLHTIKGSARMAGAMGCGDLFHSMESRIEQAAALKAVNSDLFDSLETSYDRGALLIERLQRGEYQHLEETPAAAAVAPAPAAAAAAGVSVPAASLEDTLMPGIAAPAAASVAGAPAAAAPGAQAAARAQAQLRVRADLIDNLVNEAGEVAIARARIEGEMRALKSSLLELTDNVIRLRQQVREIEIQAETQMASQISEMKAQAEIEGRAFDPLEFDRFTRFQELTRMMAESVNDVSTIQHTLLGNVTTADAALAAQARLNRELSQRLMGVRMMPFESMAERLHRVVRQAAKDVGKRANLDIKGGQMGIDRSVLEHIAGPLEHLLRNCLAHGIEAPEAREQLGKQALGQITLALAQEGNDVVLSLSDDGAGLNLQKIRQRAIERGLMGEDDPTDDAHLIGMIFHSGFSTADSVSTLAGRGVGMDVVKTEIESLGGRIEVSTSAGKGSVFRLYLPLTLAVSQAVIVMVGHRSYALPASMVEQASEFKPEVIDKIRAEGSTEWLGRKYPYRYLPQLLGMREATPTAARRHWLLLIKGGTERLAIEIDGMVGNREIVIKNLGQQLRRIPGLAGATVLGNGEIALILNPIALYGKLLQVEAGAGPGSGVTLGAEASIAADTDTAPVAAVQQRRQPSDATVMVVDDSLTVRKVTGRLLGRHGYQVATAKDGVDALEQLGDLRPDVMLLDIEMPRMDGFELTRNIRADAKLKNIPIIMITSRSADKHRNYAQEIGVNHYLGKPYDETTLLELIDSFVNPPSQETPA